MVISEMNCCFESSIHEYSPHGHIHVQILHRIAWWSSSNLPDHLVDGLRIWVCLWRYGKEVFQCRFFVALTFRKRLRDGFYCFSCKWFPTSFVSLRNRLVTPRLRFRFISFFFLMRQVSLLLFLQPAKLCILQSHLRRWSCVEWTCFKIHPATRFPQKLQTSADLSWQSDLMRQWNLSQ